MCLGRKLHVRVCNYTSNIQYIQIPGMNRQQTLPERQGGNLTDWCLSVNGFMCTGAQISDTQSETETSVEFPSFKDLLPAFLVPDKRRRANKKHKNMKAHIPLSLLRGSIETTVSPH